MRTRKTDALANLSLRWAHVQSSDEFCGSTALVLSGCPIGDSESNLKMEGNM